MHNNYFCIRTTGRKRIVSLYTPLSMKKLLEVCQYGDFDIRFSTDIRPEQLNKILPELSAKINFSMTTSLWGGIEQVVLAIIRCLAIADLAACVNRKQMLKMLDKASEDMARIMVEARKEFEAKGGKIATFGPEIMPSKTKS